MLVRIDDYPTGVKPIIENRFEKFDEVLSLFEKAKIPYHLGVVPMLIDQDDVDYLNSLEHVNLCIHGYDHNFERWKTHPEDREEFRDHTYQEIIEKLHPAIMRCYEMGLDVLDVYIPTFNRINQTLLDALSDLGCGTVTTGVQYDTSLNFYNMKRVTPRNEFYGKSSEIYENMHLFSSGYHIALHLKWEVEEKKKYGENWRLPWIIKFLENYV